MKYLITGGAGFIGSNLAEDLIKKNEVVVIDNLSDYYDENIKLKNLEQLEKNKNFKFYKASILDIDEMDKIFDKEKFDFIIHLAGQAGVRDSIENPFNHLQVNCEGTLSILELAKKHNIKNIIFASSSSIYGNLVTPFNESMKTDNPISVYAATKKSSELLSHAYHQLYNINIFILRFFTVYGPKQRPDLAISKFVKLMLESSEIPMYGEGNTKRDYTYIDDVINAVNLSINYMLEHDNTYEVLNIGSNNPISLKDMIDIISKELKVTYKINKLPMQKGDVDITYADITKAKDLIGYSPKTSFEEGIKKYISWYKNNE